MAFVVRFEQGKKIVERWEKEKEMQVIKLNWGSRFIEEKNWQTQSTNPVEIENEDKHRYKSLAVYESGSEAMKIKGNKGGDNKTVNVLGYEYMYFSGNLWDVINVNCQVEDKW